jgi:two-component system response regulator HydG
VKRPEVLVVDDKENMLKLLERILGETYTVTPARDGSEALALLETTTFDLVLTDIKMPGADGFEILAAVKKRTPETEVVMMTAYSSIARAVEAIKGGAYDYLQKPFDPDEVLLLVARALERKQLLDQTRNLRKELAVAQGFVGFIGKSPKIAAIYSALEQAARLDITVLITGQSGTGKELIARAIHQQSARAARRFVAVNCGALPTELVESELFGHAKGSFTGATVAKPGLFEEAQGGTIFFDEIGDLPLAVQVKLNRALQEHEIRRVGENTAVRIDVRVIAATHTDLKAEVSAGRFREDLFYRLNVFPIELPPLCERRDDIPLLALHFLQKHTKTYQRQIEGFEPAALRALGGYHWPGNVRQLENAV